MFRCKNCKTIDDFTLLLSPDYRGEGKINQKFNENKEIVLKVDGYEFIPDLMFMNSHSVCRYCGEIQQWEYYFPHFHNEAV